MTNRLAIRRGTEKRILLAASVAWVLAAPILFGSGIGLMSVAQAQTNSSAALSPDDIARRRAEQAMPRTAISYDVKQFDKYVGHYQMPQASIFFTIHRDGDHLLTRLTGQQDVEVYPESPTKFFAKVVAAQFSFDTDAQGHVTQLVLHQGGMEQAAKKVADSVAIASDAAFDARFKSQTPDPARAAPLRRFIQATVKGTPAFDIMSPGLADAVRQQKSGTDQIFQKTGALKSITFKAVGPGGMDIYTVTFENAVQEWRIGPLSPDGKIDGIVFRPAP
jgi:hypothetical protein